MLKTFQLILWGHEAPYCVNLKDDVTGFIAQNYLDSISDALGMQYQQLYHLLTRLNMGFDINKKLLYFIHKERQFATLYEGNAAILFIKDELKAN